MDTSQNWLAFSLSNPSYLLQAQQGEEGPKLEDFLGGCNDHQQPLRYSEAETGDVIYVDSELKSIEAGFLRGTSAVEQEVEGEKAAVAVAAEARKTVDTFGQRTSIYRGVTKHRWTGRYEAHLWDNSSRREGQSRKGRQVYLGGYDKEEKAARAYDLAALKYWGPTTTTNFPVANYEKELEEMKNMTRQEFVASLRRKSSGFSRGASIYRGVTRHHQHGRWQARIGRVAGNKDLYLGTFSTQEEAAEAYDIAAIKFRGLNAVTNFDMSRYDVKSIANSSLPIGGMAGRSKAADNSATSASSSEFLSMDLTSKHQMDGFSVIPFGPDQDYWSLLALQQHQQQRQHHQQQQSNQSPLGFGLFSSGVNMDFRSGSACNDTNTGSHCQGLVWSNAVLQQQEQSESHSNSSASSSIPYATPINGFGSVGYEGQSSNYVGSWNPQPSSSHYDYQSAKPNVAFFQTPIFGME